MFTGIIEELGIVKQIKTNRENLDITISCSFVDALQIDQSIAHNGVCLTVIAIHDSTYTVTAIAETLQKTNFKFLQEGAKINLERAMQLGNRLDGHLVQGHVDQTGICTSITEKKGSWEFSFSYSADLGNTTIEKGSITINGVSLTVVNSKKNTFSVAIIPYTYKHTNFKYIKENSVVNLEFDVIGKYVAKLMQAYR